MGYSLICPFSLVSWSPFRRSSVRIQPRPAEVVRSVAVVPSASLSSSRKGGSTEDDYHATVRTLNSRGRHTARKSLGQHYMLNPSINEQLASIAEIEEGDVVLEIGPGTGSLTSVLLKAGATVLAVEKDLHIAGIVKERFKDVDQLVVLQEDFTNARIHSHINSLLEEKRSNGSSSEFAKVVANLPFNISTDVIKKILPMGDAFSYAVLLLQDEAALRLVNCSSVYRSINVFVNFYSDPEYKFRVERENFFPQPNVDAAVVAFKLKKPADYPPVTSTTSFFSTVNSAFNGKRKMLRKTLMHLCTSSETEDALRNIGLPITSRPEDLTLDDFVKLHNLIMRT